MRGFAVIAGGLFNLTSENEVDIQKHALVYALQEATERFKHLDFQFEPEIKEYQTDRNAFAAGKSGNRSKQERRQRNGTHLYVHLQCAS